MSCGDSDNFSEVEVTSDLDTASVDLSLPPGQDPGNNPKGAMNVRGYAAKVWGRMLKDCIQSGLMKKGEVEYLGMSNDMGIGTISDEGLGASYKIIDSTTFSPEELRLMLKLANPGNCAMSVDTKFDLEAALQARLNVQGSDSLNAAIAAVLKSGKKVKMTVKSWQKDELLLDELKGALKRNLTPRKEEFIESLREKDRVLMNRAIIIKGFTAEIDASSEFTPSVAAQISGGATATVADGSGNVKVSMTNTKTLKFDSDQTFILFGKYVQSDKVKTQ